MQKGSGLKLMFATVLAAVAAGAAITSASGAPSKGGLSLAPTVIERTAAVGAGGTVTVTNHSASKLDVTVAARPWIQAADGAVSPNRRATMSTFSVSAASFTLAPGAKQDVTCRLALGRPAVRRARGRRPAAGRGHAPGPGRRLPAHRQPADGPVRARAEAQDRVGQARAAKMLALPVTNRGNTVQPVSGDGAHQGRAGHAQHVACLDAHPARARRSTSALVSAQGLPAGAYKAKIVLKQGKERTRSRATCGSRSASPRCSTGSGRRAPPAALPSPRSRPASGCRSRRRPPRRRRAAPTWRTCRRSAPAAACSRRVSGVTQVPVTGTCAASRSTSSSGTSAKSTTWPSSCRTVTSRSAARARRRGRRR